MRQESNTINFRRAIAAGVASVIATYAAINVGVDYFAMRSRLAKIDSAAQELQALQAAEVQRKANAFDRFVERKLVDKADAEAPTCSAWWGCPTIADPSAKSTKVYKQHVTGGAK